MIGSRLAESVVFCLALSFAVGAAERRPEDHVIQVKAKWSERIRLLPNRGKGAVSPLQKYTEILKPTNIKKLSGFTSFKNTKLTLSTFDLRSREIVDAMEEALEAGVHIDFYVDAINVLPARKPSSAEMKAWSTSQKNYYMRSYDDAEDPDGVVSEADLEAWNFDKFLGIELWKRLKKLAKVYPHQLNLIPTPHEMVPKSEHAAYPRIHHVKGVGVRFRQARGAWQAPSYYLAGSVNFTDTCMDSAGRIFPRLDNYHAYLEGEKPQRVKGSTGHIQFQGEFFAKRGENFIEALMKPLEEMQRLYAKGKHFDEGPLSEKLLPKVLFKDGSVLQAFYSEGVSTDSRQTIDPIKTILKKYLSNVDIEINKYYETQFVYTHHYKAAHMRQLLKKAIEDDTLEDAFIAVDGGFSEIPESALDDLLFADKVAMGDALRGRTIQRRDQLPKQFEWQKHVHSFVGDPSRIGNQRHSDKLHSKFMYVEYTDEFKVRHHLLVFGSGNSSSNSGKLSFDVFFVLDSPDPELGKIVKDYVDGVRKEKRLKPYYQTWLLRRFLEAFGPSMNKLLGEDLSFIDNVAHYLSGNRKRKDSFEKIYDQLLKTRTKEVYGKNILAILKWIKSHPTLANKLSWSDWHLLLRLAHPFQKNFLNFRFDLEWYWIQAPHLGRVSKAERESLVRSFRKMLNTLEIDSFEDAAARAPKSSRLESIIQENLKENCEHFLGLDVDYYPHQLLEQWGEPGHGV
jgi:hypothetical protein